MVWRKLLYTCCKFENLSTLEEDQTGPRQGLIGMVGENNALCKVGD